MQSELDQFRLLAVDSYLPHQDYADQDGDTHFEWYTNEKVVTAIFYSTKEDGEDPIMLFVSRKGVCKAKNFGFVRASDVFQHLQQELDSGTISVYFLSL